MMYGKYGTRGGVECQIQHKAKPSAAFDMRPHLEYYIFHTLRVNTALTDLLLCVGRISTQNVMRVSK